MKLTKIILCAAIAGAMAFAANQASAFPLTIKSASGKLITTANYGTNSATTTAKASKVSYNLKKMLQVVTNQIWLNTSNATPLAYSLVYDPYTGITYLTNNIGYYHNLSGIAYVSIYDIATTFKGNANGGSENDTIGVELDIYGYGPDGLYYEAEAYGTGSLTASLNNQGVTKMTISLKNGSGYAEFESSDDGNVQGGSFSATGSGVAPVGGIPFSIWWY